MKSARCLIFVLLSVFLIQINAVFAAPPEIEYFNVERVFPNEIQFSWKVTDFSGLTSLEIYDSDVQVYKEILTGTTHKSSYQIPNDNQTHKFKLVVYDSLGLYTEVTKSRNNEAIPPVISAASKIISNQKNISFATNEPSVCTYGFNDKNQVIISSQYKQNYTLTNLSLKEGANQIYIKCSDEQDNTMPGFFVIDYIFDTTPPSKIQNITSSAKRISWLAANDKSGIDKYAIYNSVGGVATTYQLYWDVATDDNLFYISAIDKAGNEGERTEFNYKRSELLESNQGAENTAKQTAETKKEKSEERVKTGFTTTQIILFVIGIIFVIYACFKIYEHKTDPHGLRRYIKKRRKMRDLEIKHKYE